MNLLDELKKNPFVLAPMAGITDNPFRSFMREMGAGIVISELISAHGIEYKSQRTIDLMSFSEQQRPVGIQIFGEDADIMARAAKFVEDQGADFVDINLGCPVPKVVKKGAGSALLREPQVLFQMLLKIKKAIQIPLTIKIRTGWDQQTRNAYDITQVAADAGVLWVAIHGRTRAQGYAGLADWNYIKEVKSKSKIPIIGNGDIHSAEMAVSRLQESGCDGVMIGRGSLKNPWIFQQAQQIRHSTQNDLLERDFCFALKRLKNWVDQRGDERYSTLQMKKFVSWFSHGFPHSQSFRKGLFTLKSSGDILNFAEEYFSHLKAQDQLDTSNEAFLMGGHG